MPRGRPSLPRTLENGGHKAEMRGAGNNIQVWIDGALYKKRVHSLDDAYRLFDWYVLNHGKETVCPSLF